MALEGMATGKVVLASRVGGLPEFIPVPPNRLVVPEVSAWAMAIDEILTLAESGQLQADGNACEALKHDWAHVARQYLLVYEQVLRHARNSLGTYLSFSI